MKGYRIVLLVGLLVALVFFYLGLNEWIYSNKPIANPPPIVYKERSKEEMRKELAERIKLKEENKEKEEQKKQNIVKSTKKPEKNKINRTTNKIKAKKTKIIQVGAFSREKNAKVALKKIANMGYTAIILREDGFFKVRVKVEEDRFKDAITKLRKVFGNVIIIR